MNMKNMTSAIESLLFASGDSLSLARMAEILQIDLPTCKKAVSMLADELESAGRGVRIRQIDNSFQMHTAIEFKTYIEQLQVIRQKQGLSQSALEVLSIIAYKQPVTRIQIERIRGAASDSPLARLVERGLIRAAGRMDAPGRPILYETTANFLKSFGFASIRDLPVLDIVDSPDLTCADSTE